MSPVREPVMPSTEESLQKTSTPADSGRPAQAHVKTEPKAIKQELVTPLPAGKPAAAASASQVSMSCGYNDDDDDEK